MNVFGIQKNYTEFDFEEICVDDLDVISGGSGFAGIILGATAISTAAFATASFPGTWAVPGAGAAFVTVGAVTAGVAAGLGYLSSLG